MRSVLPINSIPKPIAINNKAYLVILKAMIWAVIVVPMLAPKIIPTACERLITSAVMKPTTRTVVTDED